MRAQAADGWLSRRRERRAPIALRWLQAFLAQRRKALTGGADADESADTEGAEDRLRLLGCVEKLIDQCFAVGDALPLIDLLSFLEDSPSEVRKAMSDADSSRLSSALIHVRESLNQCARYRVTWKFEFHSTEGVAGNCTSSGPIKVLARGRIG
jgi:hypothetical protein